MLNAGGGEGVVNNTEVLPYMCIRKITYDFLLCLKKKKKANEVKVETGKVVCSI